jgi:hypothetical protein
MSDAGKLRLSKFVFWVTVIFCSWIVWFISTPPASLRGLH